MNDLLNGLSDVHIKTAEAMRACESDGGASVVLVAKAAAEADPGLGGPAREAVLDAHLAICILKTTI